MNSLTKERRSKKVVYIELIYDLIFVFLLRRNNALLTLSSGDFFGLYELSTYLLSILIILQIWVFSVMYINRYGENSLADHCFLFANMYLLYYMGTETRLDWELHYSVYNTAWALILVNLFLQYLLKGRKVAHMHVHAPRLTYTRAILYIIEAAMVFITIPVFLNTGISFAWVPLLFGFIAPIATNRIEIAVPISFEHLTERVMLFVVFTFGEMIISLAEYFEDGFSASGIYFSVMGFLIVIGLFMSYGYLYTHVIDRNKGTNGKIYLLLHVMIILSLNNITICLEYMPNPKINVLYTSVMIIVSFIAYYLGIFLVARRTELVPVSDRPFAMPVIIGTILFVAVVLLVHETAWLAIAVTAAYVLGLYAVVVYRWRRALRLYPALRALSKE